MVQINVTFIPVFDYDIEHFIMDIPGHWEGNKITLCDADSTEFRLGEHSVYKCTECDDAFNRLCGTL